MIRISLSVLVFIYLFLFLAIVFSMWLWQGWRRQVRERQAVRFRLRCGMCAFEFEDASTTLLPRCPRCGSLNERFKFNQL
jgi:DNA-directed RNA polymerase subunit RPC12/RpoP